MASAPIRFVLAASTLAAGVLVASLASPHPASPQAEQCPLLGVVPGSRSLLVRVDSRTLRPLLGRRISVGPHLHSWALSPDRSRLAFSPHPGGVVYFVDARTLQPRGKMVFSGDGLAVWLAPRRLLWIQSSEFALADPTTRRHLMSKRIDGQVLVGVRVRDRVALLVAPSEGVGPSRLLIVDAVGGARSVDVARIRSGWSSCGGSQPGLTLDPAQRRVFVVGADDTVAEVELEILAVSYHSLGSTTSPLPPADVCESRLRTARFLAGGLIAVSGFDSRQFRGADGRRYARFDPAGLHLVDVGSWSTRTLDDDADSFRVAERQLLATGLRWDSSVSGEVTGMGVAAYALDGATRFHLFEGKRVWVVEAYTGRAYVSFERGPVAVVDLERGAMVGERSTPVPRLLVDDGVSLFGR